MTRLCSKHTALLYSDENIPKANYQGIQRVMEELSWETEG